MEIPTSRYAPRDRGGPTPSIYIEHPSHFDHRFRSSGRSQTISPSVASIPMTIPDTVRTEDDIAPPPLPPPRLPFGSSGLPAEFLAGRHSRDQPGESWASSGFGSPGHDFERLDYKRRISDRTIKSERDEGYHSLNSNLSGPHNSLPKMFMSHDQLFKPNANDYDHSLLRKFDAKRTLENRSPPRRSALSSSANDAVSRLGSSENRMHTLLTPLSLPIRSNSGSSKSFLDSPGQFTETPLPSAVSPRSTPFYANEYRSPIEPSESDRSPLMRSKRANSGSLPDDATVSTQGSYENADDADFPMEQETASGIRRLHIEDSSIRPEYQTIGQKRRASSPPGDEPPVQGLPGSGEQFRRRDRLSPQPRLTVIPQGSVSSVSSSTGRSSYASSISLTATSVTSMNSYGRRSPGGVSPIDAVCNSPFNTPMSLTHSPRSSISRVPHQRNLSDNRPLASPRKLTEMPKPSVHRIQGFFMCECCPKKPKRFETAEELSAHEAEKQYECSFCGNRFKNKNEAERHQNSLHVRRHSWSCSALHVAGYDKAFHDSTNRPGEADTCGYCGDEFMRSGGAGRNRIPTDQDWDDRLRHLQEVHKFRECNSSKKFYRADHFRQHLKHSHAGTSGKWTNMLETACMLEEEPPQPR